MPLLRYTFDELANPELVGKTIELDTDVLMLDEAEDVEKVTGKAIAVVHDEFTQDRAAGIRAFVWLAVRRAGIDLKYSELRFNVKATFMVVTAPGTEEAAPGDPLDQPETDPVSVPT
ncbi:MULTISPECIES: hypothetical protein [unclassified Crossiella]|uniref:hypothetical protein n=1 Tax=unclassified Crossiella TaxID=2620835 RepID=UPI001FFEDECB|nr:MULTISPECIES: hypothetical protein [unclassified Crossiella]MCK2242143.1 hypothetical protein [Crossiella sp. S99.2]MCK2256046.1 hypothetical protein [Crossiella sp. S99.1]